MSKYDEMSDHEINTQVTAIIYGCEKWSLSESNLSFYHCGVDGNGFYEQLIIDYCNNPNDAWPIIDESKISIKYRAGNSSLKPMASSSERDGLYYTDTNPLRAAMIVFLMMKDGEQ